MSPTRNLPPQLPHHLAGTEAQGLVPNEPVAQFRLGDYQNFVYLILDWSTREAAWVDPQDELDPALQALESHGFQLKRILLTHSHWDHVKGVPELVRRFPEVTVCVHPDETHRLKPAHLPENRTHFLRDEEVIPVGTLPIRVLHTPGHSRGECCFLLETTPPYLFSGDTLFIRDCGNTTQASGSNEEMFASLQKLKTLPGSTIMLPGHQYAPECASTLEEQWRTSPPFRCKTVQELSELP